MKNANPSENQDLSDNNTCKEKKKDSDYLILNLRCTKIKILKSLVSLKLSLFIWYAENSVLKDKKLIMPKARSGRSKEFASSLVLAVRNEVTSTTDQHYKLKDTSSKIRGHETTPLKVKEDIKHVSRGLDDGVNVALVG
ncbi:major facilitator superfamily domain-containing protein 6 [Trichonephila clavipes]|nr:major facilitator superfamily domain-containing protein 6 [Trichonephila clavipes]